MNAETFTKFIKAPDKLYKIAYTDLKSLVSQYPYCQNLRYLLLKKCVFEGHKDFDENLQLAATYSNDRDKLFQNIQSQKSNILNEKVEEVKPEVNEAKPDMKENLKSEDENKNVEVDESHELESEGLSIDEIPTNEILESNVEIKPTEKIEHENPKTTIVEEDEPVYFNENELETEIEDITEEMEFDYDLGENSSISEESEELYEKVISFEELIELDYPSEVRNNKNTPNINPDNVNDSTGESINLKDDSPSEENIKKSKEGKPPPTPKSSFGTWIKQFQESDTRELGDKPQKRKEEKKKLKKKLAVSKKKKKSKRFKKGKKGFVLAEQSLKENKEIVSETLASLLASQGSHEKAIEMFEQLSLIFPEKSSYFAAQIKKLKKF